MQLWRNFLIYPTTPLVDAARVIDSGGGQIAIVVDEQRKLLGTVTDADLRKALLTGSDFNKPSSEFMSKTPISMPIGSTREECIKVMLSRHIGQLPLIDEMGRVQDVVLITELYLADRQPNTIVIMAGGLGTRLAELTHNTPKPMLSIGGRPLLETIILQLVSQGFSRFFIAVNYKSEVIMRYFGDGSKWAISIRYIRETKRLGTAGALYLLPKDIEDDIVVMNGDILSKIDLRRLLLFHRRSQAIATMAVKDFELKVPFGVANIDEQYNIVSLLEKPAHRYFINAGIYAISPGALQYIPKNEFFDAPSLFAKCQTSGKKISAYPVREYWIDIGHMSSFERANIEFFQYFTS